MNSNPQPKSDAVLKLYLIQMTNQVNEKNMKLNTDIIEGKMCVIYAKYKSSSYPDKFLPYCLPRHAQTSNSLYATWIPDVDVNREILQKEADFCNNFAPQDEMVLQLRLGGKKVVFQTE